jgi:2-keto-3-deoxy-6-phosphogluconate aldolase
MPTRQEILGRLKATGVVAVIRVGDSGGLIEVARALAKGGASFIEITMTVPRALVVIAAREFEKISENARDFLEVVRRARSR